MAYVPVPVPAPKSTKGKNNLLIVLVCLMLLVFGIGSIALLTEDRTVYDAGQTAVADMNTGKAYYIENMAVMDSYANEEITYMDGAATSTAEVYYLVTFKDAEGKLCSASLVTEPGSDIYATCNNFLKDDTMDVGDLTLTGCFSFASIESQSDELQRYYHSAEATLSSYLITANKTSYHLTYEAAAKEDYVTGNASVGIVFLMLTALFGVALYFCLRQRKKIKAQELAAAQNPAPLDPPVTL